MTGAHRLVLTPAEWALLATASAFAPPPGFEPATVDEPDLRAAVGSLAARWVVAGGSADPSTCVPVESVAANLAVLAAPVATVRVEVTVRERGLRAYYAVAGSLGASLFALADGAVELSMFAAVRLGRELVRAVPDLVDPASEWARVDDALGGGDDEPPAGRLPLSALDRAGATVPVVAGPSAAGPSAAERALAARITARTVGTLWCLVSGRGGGGGVLIGQVVWLATGRGWVGLRPDPDGTDRRMVKVEPVTHDELGVWVAPFLAEILEVAGEQSAAARS